MSVLRLQSAVGALQGDKGDFGALAALTETTGALHEQQVQQLKMYGLACSAAVESASFEPDHDEKVIRYLLVIDKSRIEPDIGKRLAFLKKAVTVILQGWEAKIRFREAGTTTNAED